MAFVATLTGTARNCTLTSGSPTMTVSSNTGLVVGATIQGTGIPAETKITAIAGTTITMSANATAAGTQSLIFSSVYGSILTIQATASGDAPTWQNVFNAGFGLLQGSRSLFHPGALTITFGSIVDGARFDHQDWTVEFGTGGRMLFDSGLLAGEQRGGYFQAGTLLIKTDGPTFVFNNFNNATVGGSSLFLNTGGALTQGGLFRMHDARFVVRTGNNMCPAFTSVRDLMDVENLIMDYEADTGPNASMGCGFGTILNPKIIKANSGIARTNANSIGTITGLYYLGQFVDNPAAKFTIPTNTIMDGYAPQITNTQNFGGFVFAASSTETYSNINLSSAGYGLSNIPTKYLRFGGPYEIRFPRTVSFEFNDNTGADLTGVTLYIRSGAISVVNAVQAGDYSALTQGIVLNWTSSVNAYRVANTIVNTISQVAQVRKYGFIEQSTSYSIELNPYSQPFFMLPETALSGISEATASSFADITIDKLNLKVVVNATYTVNQILAKLNYLLALPENSEVPYFATVEGTSMRINSGWNLEVGATGVINRGVTLTGIIVDGQEVINNGVITVPYSDILGSRVAITGLDPQGFGVTWNVRYRKVGETTWVTISGTGNSTVILTDTSEYELQARVAGYTWKETTFDTGVVLSVDLSLQYHVADDGTPQWLKPFNSALVDIFEYDDVEMEVEVTNTTGTILQPGFPELYRVVEKVQQDPTLVWLWVNPVTTNSTSQKVLIPPTSPLRMYLSTDSDASVKITCPVVYSDTGISADDRVKGNPAGFSIILGSSATADSSLIVSQLIEQLGGQGFNTENHSLTKIKVKVDKNLTKTQYLGL